MDAREAVQKVTRTAAGILRRCGWTRGHIKNAQGQYCLVGAIQAAIAELHWQYEAGIIGTTHDAVLRTIAARDPQWDGSIEGWNDTCARDVDEVIEVLKLAGDYEWADPAAGRGLPTKPAAEPTSKA